MSSKSILIFREALIWLMLVYIFEMSNKRRIHTNAHITLFFSSVDSVCVCVYFVVNHTIAICVQPVKFEKPKFIWCVNVAVLLYASFDFICAFKKWHFSEQWTATICGLTICNALHYISFNKTHIKRHTTKNNFTRKKKIFATVNETKAIAAVTTKEWFWQNNTNKNCTNILAEWG